MAKEPLSSFVMYETNTGCVPKYTRLQKGNTDVTTMQLWTPSILSFSLCAVTVVWFLKLRQLVLHNIQYALADLLPTFFFQFHVVFANFGKIICEPPSLPLPRRRVGVPSYGKSWIHPCFVKLTEIVWRTYCLMSNLTAKRYGNQTSIEINDKRHFSQNDGNETFHNFALFYFSKISIF